VPENLLPIVKPHGESTPPTANDPETARRVKAALAAQLGADMMSSKKREGMGAEDFAYFVAPEHGVKGVYMSVGGTPAADLATAASHHSPLFKVSPEPAIVSGVQAMTLAAMELLDKP
jgi:metal-dependent amidase/aminoacylase/carboxypeptidase family protein